MGMCGGDSAPAPDPGIGAAAVQNAAVADRQQTFAEQQYADQKSYYDKLVPTYDHLLQGQVELADLNKDLATKSAANTEKYAPLEDQNREEAMNAGNAASQETAAGKAGVDMSRSFDMAKASNNRTMAQMGVNPNSGRFQEANRSTDIMQAASTAGAVTAARSQEKARGESARIDQANFGRGFAATQMSASSVAGSNAAGAQGIGNGTLNASTSIGSNLNSGLNSAASTRTSAASILQGQQSYGASVTAAKNASNDQTMGAIGSVVGIAAMAMM